MPDQVSLPRAPRIAKALLIAGTLIPAAVFAADRNPPNLEGIWTGGTLTPMERPAPLRDKAFITPEEVAAQQAKASERFWAAGHQPHDVGRDNDAFIDDDLVLLRSGQTSLIVRPATGIAPLRPEAEQRRQIHLNGVDSYETMSQWDRCITRAPTEIFPVVYNNAYQIVQTPTHIVLSAEMIHDTRIIPLDGRPHADSRIKTWAGDSRGRWEGSTLVVETRNFNGLGWIATGQTAGRVRGAPYSEDMRITERFTLTDPKTLQYEITIDDPKYYTEPWTISFPLHRDDSYVMYEYACHEGNHAIELILRGARVQEQKK
ncbi:hypothetical protein HNQ60_001328 [Povalibacter uvarum]|uniref:Uncharacterized protein n=1 Tax=Povalibacter uvarum TaxID=732238 RepID=A0A841HJH5_9GAMM|nr:hypothetical protein [Povalibacter uvarum]MBB6092450.1 hypothetical protein [Povalibacter uvarum]